jgi:hypothetical protein
MNEMSKTDLSPTVKAILALTQGLLPAMTAIVGGLWIVFTYVKAQDQQHQQQVENTARELRTRISFPFN